MTEYERGFAAGVEAALSKATETATCVVDRLRRVGYPATEVQSADQVVAAVRTLRPPPVPSPVPPPDGFPPDLRARAADACTGGCGRPAVEDGLCDPCHGLDTPLRRLLGAIPEDEPRRASALADAARCEACGGALLNGDAMSCACHGTGHAATGGRT